YFAGTAPSRYASCRMRRSPPVTFGLKRRKSANKLSCASFISLFLSDSEGWAHSPGPPVSEVFPSASAPKSPLLIDHSMIATVGSTPRTDKSLTSPQMDTWHLTSFPLRIHHASLRFPPCS